MSNGEGNALLHVVSNEKIFKTLVESIGREGVYDETGREK
jgi:hypothetical protein